MTYTKEGFERQQSRIGVKPIPSLLYVIRQVFHAPPTLLPVCEMKKCPLSFHRQEMRDQPGSP